MISRRDYTLIADSLRNSRRALSDFAGSRQMLSIVEQTLDVTTLMLALDLEKIYPSFDRDKFLFAVYKDDKAKYESMRSASVELLNS
jgi:hypothetical protein